MVSPKPRSGSSEIAPKSSSSVNSKTIPVSKHNKGTPASSEINSKSPKTLGLIPSKVTNLSQKRVVKGSEMQQHMGQFQEELMKTKEQLMAVEEEKDRLLDELREMKKVAQEANMRLSEALTQGSSEIEKSRVEELEKARIESAKKREQVWQLELEVVQKQHALDVEALSSAAQELNVVSQKLASALKVKDAALKEAEDVQNFSEVNAKMMADLSVELNSVRELLTNSNLELEVKEKEIEYLKHKLVKAQHIQVELEEKEVSLDKLKQELSNAKLSGTHAVDFLSESKIRVQSLETELKQAKESETKNFDSLNTQTKQLEQTKILLEESKLEISSLREKVESLEGSVAQSSRELNVSHHSLEKAKLNKQSMKKTFETLKPEDQVVKESLACAQEGEKIASSKATSSLSEELSLLRTELKSATEAEEESKKAMDDLALALKEVATEANQVKEKLRSTQSEIENARGEAEHSKQMVKSTEDKFGALLDEAKKEFDRVSNVAERLRLESEESILAWNAKEMGFIACIKRTEEESTAAQQENSRLRESLRVVEDMNKVSREENHKLRDILKQALNEATVAKEAAEIARTENSQLKDSLFDKDNTLDSFTRENERLRINEVAAHENIKELKWLLSTTSTKDLRTEDKELERVFKKQNSMIKDHKDGKKLTKVLSLNLKDLKFPATRLKDAEEDPKKTETLKGSIFDIVDSPEQVSHHRKASSSVFTDDGETINSEDFDHLNGAQLDDIENDRNLQRKKKALLRRFGDLIRRRSFHRKEPSIG
ncbi:hypothetical protein HHK36_008128 [Tetracentron sinense]|uniref:Uncharacterized protein n=1 Tax=Tetracentron sinense TaxID=13715 RepID=A0A835DJM2_TETSI|nr:hypothetical protein HHK36_008128 [Tetracentron sinense]